jgi:prepilin peptidase dependent protein B
MFRKGFSILELLIVAAIGLLVILGGLSFFSSGFKTLFSEVSTMRERTSILQAVELIKSDLAKAGYGIADKTTYPPIEWNSSDKELIIRYVDFSDSSCELKSFSPGDNCSYIVYYKLEDGKLIRKVDEEADGSFAAAPLFDEDKVKVSDFEVSYNGTIRVINYKIAGKIKGKTFSFENSIFCRNCN